MDRLEYNRKTGWLCQIWTALLAAARLPGMSDDMRVHYAIRAIKHSSLVPVYESTPIEQVHTLGDACWTEIAFLMTVLDSYCMPAFKRHGKTDYWEYTNCLLNDLDDQVRGWETVEDYLPLLEGDYHEHQT